MKQKIKERVEKIRKGEVPEGYQKTKVGIIPDDWLVSFTDDVAKRGTGHTPNKKFPSYYNGGIKWISLQDSNKLDNGLIFHTKVEISEEGLSNSSAILHSKGSVLISRDAGVGKSAIMGNEMAVSQHFITWTCSDKLNNWYLYHYLQKSKSEFERIAVGSTIKTIGMPFFKKYKIPLPLINEQEKIVEILSIWDKAIELKVKLIEEKKAFKRGVMQKLLAGEMRYPEFSGEWEEVKIGDIITEFFDFTAKNNQHEILSVTKNGICLQSDQFKKQIASSDNIGYKIITKGDLVFSTMNLWMGSLDILKSPNIGLVSPAYKTFNINYDKVDGDFFEELIKSSKMLWIYKINSEQGASIVRRNLDLCGLLSTKIKIPEIHEQKKIGQFIKEINSEYNGLVQSLENAKEQKIGLMQLLLTGIIRVEVN